jgi:hypothetical protein
MKKEYLLISGLVILLSIVACCTFLGQYILSGCFFWECAPKRNFHVLDWELPPNLFPAEAMIDRISPPSDGYGLIESGEQTIYIGHNPAVYTIERFPRVKNAIDQYARDKKHMRDPKTNMEWKPPNTLTFSSATADEFYIACGDFFQYRCEMVARYQEYIVFFGAMINDEMPYAQFENIVAYIDKQISSRLYP